MLLFNNFVKSTPGGSGLGALCIDMADHPERLRQVTYMHTICSLANRVYLWSGRGTMSTDAVMDHFATHAPQAILLRSELSQLYIPNPRNGDLRREVDRIGHKLSRNA